MSISTACQEGLEVKSLNHLLEKNVKYNYQPQKNSCLATFGFDSMMLQPTLASIHAVGRW